MTAQLIYGKKLAKSIQNDIKHDIQHLSPHLAVILVGNDPASEIYVANKQRACAAVGIQSTLHRISTQCTQEAISTLIDQLNDDETVHGILLQLPLPAHIDKQSLLERIHPQKDVDGFHPYNLGRLAQGAPLLRPCTPYGVIQLLQSTGESLAGRYAVVVGASIIVGRPMALELLLVHATPTICHKQTQHLSQLVQMADILISATGKPGVIQSEWIKPGAIVIDVGFSRLSNGKITGDIDFESARERASWITPVPGGVGPMTVSTLLQNTVMATKMVSAAS